MKVEVSETVVVEKRRLRRLADGRIQTWDASQTFGGEWVATNLSILLRDGVPLIDSRHPWWGMLQAYRVECGLPQFECPWLQKNRPQTEAQMQVAGSKLERS